MQESSKSISTIQGPALHRYQEVVHLIQQWIDTGILKVGERLPSIRQMSVKTGYSPVTIHHSYGILESEGFLKAHPRSGFYVAEGAARLADFAPERRDFHPPARPEAGAPPLYALMAAWRHRRLESFGSAQVSPDLLPLRELGIHFQRALREEIRRPGDCVPPEGDPMLRDFIAKRAAHRGAAVRGEDVVITPDANCALGLCLYAATKPGDVVLIESPSYFPLFTALRRRQLQVLEIYSHPTTGIDPDQFDYLLGHNRVSACILMPVHHFPTGVTYADETMRRVVEIATRHRTPIIENDAYGELTQGLRRASSFKRFDTDDFVMQCGSFADTLGPRYGLGWIISDRYRTQVLEQSFMDGGQTGDVVLQHAIAQYMHQHSYDRHLRRMRDTIATRMRRGLTLISQHFPRSCSLSRPSGGFMCWLRGPSSFDSLPVAIDALEEDISILPGSLFSVTGSFRNFAGLNLSFPWDSAREAKVMRLAEYVACRQERPHRAADSRANAVRDQAAAGRGQARRPRA